MGSAVFVQVISEVRQRLPRSGTAVQGHRYTVAALLGFAVVQNQCRALDDLREGGREKHRHIGNCTSPRARRARRILDGWDEDVRVTSEGLLEARIRLHFCLLHVVISDEYYLEGNACSVTETKVLAREVQCAA